MLKRIAGIIIRPRHTWDDIAASPTSMPEVAGLLVLLSLLPAISIAIGLSVFDIDWSPAHGYRPAGRPLVIGATNFAICVVTVLLLAVVLHWLAVPPGSRRKPFVHALNVAVFGSVPVFLAGASLVLPVMVVVVMVTGLHSLYLLSAGMQQVLGVEAGEASMLLAVCIVALSVTTAILGALGSALGVI